MTLPVVHQLDDAVPHRPTVEHDAPGTVAGLRGICQVIDPIDDPATSKIEEAAQ